MQTTKYVVQWTNGGIKKQPWANVHLDPRNTKEEAGEDAAKLRKNLPECNFRVVKITEEVLDTVPIVLEPDGLVLVENCHFCGKPTRHWLTKPNIPLCVVCSFDTTEVSRVFPNL